MKSKFKKWHLSDKAVTFDGVNCGCKLAWNAALKEVLKLAKNRNKEFKGNWQHEDIEFLIEDIEEMMEK